MEERGVPNLRPAGSAFTNIRSNKRSYSNDFIYTQDMAPVVLVLELKLSGYVGYYFVSHETQSVFWLDPFNLGELMVDLRVEYTDWMAGLQMKSLYWYHNDLFPHLYELRDDDIQELEDMVEFAIGGQ
jgi:hypothetical protein